MNKKNISAALLMALVVGTALNLINSYEVFAEAKFINRNVMRIMLAYIAPFCVSLYSAGRVTMQMAANNN